DQPHARPARGHPGDRVERPRGRGARHRRRGAAPAGRGHRDVRRRSVDGRRQPGGPRLVRRRQPAAQRAARGLQPGPAERHLPAGRRARRPHPLVLRAAADDVRGTQRRWHAAGDPLPRGGRRRDRPPPGIGPPAAPAAGRRPADGRHHPRARAAGHPAGRRRSGHRHVVAQRAPARLPGPQRVRRRRAGPAAGDPAVVRLQERGAGGRRHGRRRPVPAQPALGARAASADRAQPAGERLRPDAGGRGALPGPPAAAARHRGHRLRARGQALRHHRHRLHRRQAPQHGDGRGVRPPVARRRPAHHRAAPGPGPGM
ncbi:MAG: RNase adapter protein RapZ, partial [uncultured Friedmanniella sp.]